MTNSRAIFRSNKRKTFRKLKLHNHLVCLLHCLEGNLKPLPANCQFHEFFLLQVPPEVAKLQVLPLPFVLEAAVAAWRTRTLSVQGLEWHFCGHLRPSRVFQCRSFFHDSAVVMTCNFHCVLQFHEFLISHLFLRDLGIALKSVFPLLIFCCADVLPFPAWIHHPKKIHSHILRWLFYEHLYFFTFY